MSSSPLFLYPGQIGAITGPAGEIGTILGSCVSVILIDQTNNVIAMNHHVLPEVMAGETPTCRHGEHSLRSVLDLALEKGARKENLRAIVVGGAKMFEGTTKLTQIGERNVEVAETFLRNQRIPIVQSDTGGTSGRRISIRIPEFKLVSTLSNERESGIKDSSLRVAKSVRVLIVDDSATVRSLLSNAFKANGLTVVGTAADVYAARELIVKEKPDVITLDIEMPKMNGVAFLEKLMQHLPIPVVMVSSLQADGDAALRALELGAIEFVHKPSQFDPIVLKQMADQLVAKVRAAASVDLKKYLNRSKSTEPVRKSPPVLGKKSSGTLDLVAISGNAGAEQRLVQMVEGFASDTPPVVISCSTISGFAETWCKKLAASHKSTGLNFRVIHDGEPLRVGSVNVAPAGSHVTVSERNGLLTAKLVKGESVMGQTPSGDVLFKSLVSNQLGPRSLGIVTSTFGADGVQGARDFVNSGGTLFVDSPSGVVFPHAMEALIAEGLPNEVLSAHEIGPAILMMRSKRVAA